MRIGAFDQPRSSRQTSTPLRSGKDEVEDDCLGRARGRLRQRLLAGGGGVHLVAGAAERRLERAQDLRLVVDDEDAAMAAHASASTGTSTSGSASTKDAPCPCRDSAQTRPPFPFGEAPGDGEAEPAAAALAALGRAAERLEDALELRLGDARAAVDDAHEHLAAGRRHPDVHGLAGAART